jgi:membrane fusion protein, copper/silver efflux system
MQKQVTQGQKIETGMQLYQITDLSRVWVVVDLYSQDLPYVKVGQKVTVELQYFSSKPFEGLITYISPTLDPDSKTAAARIEVKNTPDFEIKPGMFATVKILTPVVTQVLAVPQQAIIYSGERHIVIVALGNGYFKPVEVKCGISAQGYAQNISGLQEGPKVVTSAQFLIDSESNLKAAIQQLGAGSQDMPGMDMTAKNKQPELEKQDMKNMKH